MPRCSSTITIGSRIVRCMKDSEHGKLHSYSMFDIDKEGYKVVWTDSVSDVAIDKVALSNLILEAIFTEGGHHKQYYLEEIADTLGIELPEDHEEGIAP